MEKDIVLVGGGGHVKACIDVIEKEGRFKIAGIVDVKQKLGAEVLGYKVFAADEDMPALASKYKNFLISLGQIKNHTRRKELFDFLKGLGVCLPAVVSPFSYVSVHSEIGEASIVMHGAHINAGASIGRNCIINTASIIEHDSIVRDHSHISMSSVIAGSCDIGEGVFIGANSVISNNLKIADKVIIGAGSVVITSIEESGTYAGNPVRLIR